MAEKRMISKVISVSEKINTLPEIFDMLLFTWMIPHTDDFGRIPGSAAKIKALVVPMLDKSIKEVEESLNRLYEAGTIILYELNGEKIIQLLNFDKHQEGLKRRTPSKYPPPPDSRYLPSNNVVLSASESEIEELVIQQLENNNLIVGDEIISTERQLRVNNSYIDILATGNSGNRYLFEIKRQRLSNSSIEQIIKYREMLGDSKVISILIGNGLASNFDFQKCRDGNINVLVYDNSLNTETILSNDVKCRQITLNSEGKGIELKGTEGNRTEENGTEGKGIEMPSPDNNPHKDRIHKLINDCKIEDYTLNDLDVIYSYIGVCDIEVIEYCIKKGQGKHVNYAIRTLQGKVKEGITKKEQVLPPKPEVGDNNAKSEGLAQGMGGTVRGNQTKGISYEGQSTVSRSKWDDVIIPMPGVQGRGRETG